MKAIVLAGGEGTRLRPLSFYFQKCMMPLGRQGKPLMEYIVRLLCHHGICDVKVLVGAHAEQITNYFEDGSRFGARMTYHLDQPDLKGTGNAVLPALTAAGDEDVMIFYGDILSNIDLGRMLALHREAGADLTLALARDFPIPVGVADVTDADGPLATVHGFREKPRIDMPVNIGIYIVRAAAFADMRTEPDGVLDLNAHLIPRLIDEGGKVRGYLTNEFWYDVGSIERLEKLSDDMVASEMSFLLP